MTESDRSIVGVDVLALTYDRDSCRVRYGVRSRTVSSQELSIPSVVLRSGERLREAAERAVRELGLRVAPSAIGHLLTSDGPAGDAREPGLSVVMWAVYGSLLMGEDTGDSQWEEVGAQYVSAADPGGASAAASEILPRLLWNDLAFTRALTGDRFFSTDAVAMTCQLTGQPVQRAEVDRMLKRIPGLVRTRNPVRPGPRRAWTWRQD